MNAELQARGEWPRWVPSVVGPFAALGLMLAIGLWALQFRALDPPVPLIWPAAGIALALCYRCGWPASVGVAVGTAWLHAGIGTPLGPAAALGVFTGLAGIASARILRRLRFDPTLARVRDALALLLVGGGLTALLSGVGGTFVAVGLSPAFPKTFGLCWIADAMGLVLLAPPLLAVRMPQMPVWRELEAAAWIVLGAVFVYAVYNGGLSAATALAASYAVFPLVLAVALRFGAAITSLAVAAIAAVALACTGADTGPFARSHMVANVLSMHAQLAMLGLTGLLFASARAERDDADERAREHLRTLARAGRLDAMSSMAAGIAHELNQPLSAVNSYAHAAQRMLAEGRTGDDVAGALERVVKGNERAAEIVRRVRGFLRGGEEGRETVDLNTLAREAIELVVPEYRRRRVTLTSERRSGPLYADVDPVAIRQVTVNLLQNALDAASAEPADGRWVRVTARRSDDGACAEILVDDSGPGIAPDERERLFQPLVTGRADGTGLGLAIVRSLVEAHAGRVTAEAADEGGGARLRVRLPVVQQAMEAA